MWRPQRGVYACGAVAFTESYRWPPRGKGYESAVISFRGFFIPWGCGCSRAARPGDRQRAAFSSARTAATSRPLWRLANEVFANTPTFFVMGLSSKAASGPNGNEYVLS